MKLLQIWKFSGPGRDADNLDEAISIAVQNGFDSLLVKALDGTHWMRDYDGSPDAIGSADQVASPNSPGSIVLMSSTCPCRRPFSKAPKRRRALAART